MQKITVADYLIKQLENLGITDIFGLPGDFNFNIIEAVEANTNTNWIGCTNELNAGYAADGYARVKGYGALVTTYGVGELSAVNAIAGSYAEYVPVIKITGIPSTKHIKNNTLLHHNFAQPDYKAFERVYSNVVETTAYLNAENAKSEIDRVISEIINKKRPVYIAIPEDICLLEIDDNPNITVNISNENNLISAVNHIMQILKRANNPIVLADILVERFEAKDELKNLLQRTQYPATTLLMGKGMINWDYEGFIGTYIGQYDNKVTYDYINKSDCVITIGAIFSDLNTFGFDININPSQMIDIEGSYTTVENVRYENVLMKDILSKLSEIAPKNKNPYPKRELSFFTPEVAADDELTAEFIYPLIQDFLKEDDIIFSETGIVEFGFAPMKLPKSARIYNQVLWGSIGWATPAAFGAAIAEKEKRIILMTGDGSHQLTAQEVSSMMRYGLKPIIIVLNNDGYTVERLLCKNSEDPFNDIARWNYSMLPLVFEGSVKTMQARTNKEFLKALQTAEFEQEKSLCYIEIFTGKMDLPKLAKNIAKNKLIKQTAIPC